MTLPPNSADDRAPSLADRFEEASAGISDRIAMRENDRELYLVDQALSTAAAQMHQCIAALRDSGYPEEMLGELLNQHNRLFEARHDLIPTIKMVHWHEARVGELEQRVEEAKDVDGNYAEAREAQQADQAQPATRDGGGRA